MVGRYSLLSLSVAMLFSVMLVCFVFIFFVLSGGLLRRADFLEVQRHEFGSGLYAAVLFQDSSLKVQCFTSGMSVMSTYIIL
jgi:hypothetical protein